ncbi:hypothetical protein ASPBRDRAFT_372711 [Aspergillus brasiliensis CBS 101740]|uniref:Uncharacterized protein n=1 Tax=Aspergillus brasiliensis (strain CBS 101740 / IMI 381727 / IBT 21946) TaxID=767769 RepID=A0A1L9UVA7_ASPBC|nr:hypothetical protein ASPBRDRAFT_372711 [Aspergillus brasiliensis CBS 101740]
MHRIGIHQTYAEMAFWERSSRRDSCLEHLHVFFFFTPCINTTASGTVGTFFLYFFFSFSFSYMPAFSYLHLTCQVFVSAV